MVEEYGSTGLFTGLKRYDGPFSFKRFEKYLYGKSNCCIKYIHSKMLVQRIKK